ncbi:MAG: calcium/sodium antiporter [Bacteroidales bacterium]|nr:calcium/sodium antiporter [Bacteroidales bacterium]
MSYLLFVVGFVLIIMGANWLVDGGTALGKRFNIPNIVIGLTIVSLGTSAPELIISLLASIKGNTDLAIANVLGSNIFNVFIIIGFSAAVYPVAIKKNTTWKEIPFSLLAAVALGLLANDVFLDKMEMDVLSRIDGLIFLAFFAIFISYTIFTAKNQEFEEVSSAKDYTPAKASLFILAGLVGLYFGGNWIVEGSSDVARLLGIRETDIGLVIVATATSLPELVTSAVAAYKKNSDIAIGNALGSNIFNIFLVLGLSAFFNNLPFNKHLMMDVWVAIGSHFILFLFIFASPKGKPNINRIEGIIMLAIYVAFITWTLAGK